MNIKHYEKITAKALRDATAPICDGCDGAMSFSPGKHDVCWDCVKSRHRAAITHRCSCGKKRRPMTVVQAGAKRIKCKRCLGAITSKSIK